MIETDEQLDIVREQLSRAEAALVSLRETVRPQSEERFRLMSEAYVEQILGLRAQVNEYLGISAVDTISSDLVIGLEGQSVRFGEVPASLVIRVLDTFRRGLQSLLEMKQSHDATQRTSGRRKQWIERLCDPPIVGLAPGSVQIHLGEPDTGELFTQEDRQLYRAGIDLLVAGLAWASGDDERAANELASAPEMRHELLTVVRKLVPPRSGLVEAVSFQGRAIGAGRSFRLTQATRSRVDAELKRIATTVEQTEVTGTIREVDLDQNTFILRERDGGLPNLECEYDERDEADVIAYLNQKVLIAGTMRTSTKAKRQTMEVETIEAQAPSDRGNARDE